MPNTITTTADDHTVTVTPEDLNARAVKVARRIQALADGSVYRLTLVKRADVWWLAVGGEEMEVVR